MGLFGRSNTTTTTRELPTTQPPPRSKTTPTTEKNATAEPHDSSLLSRIHLPIPSLHHHADPPPTAPQKPSKPKRGKGKNVPPALVRQPSVQTRYMDMLLHLDTIPKLHNMLASFFTWILLAGYVIFPGTFTTLQQSKTLAAAADANEAGRFVLGRVRNAPLLWVAAVCCLVGGAGMCWLWYKWRANFVWLVNRIFLPGALNSLAGLINTLVNVYTAQNGDYSITAKVTVIVTGACLVINLILFLLYNNWALQRVKNKHKREMDLSGTAGNAHEGEGVLEKIHRKANEPGLEPGSVV